MGLYPGGLKSGILRYSSVEFIPGRRLFLNSTNSCKRLRVNVTNFPCFDFIQSSSTVIMENKLFGMTKLDCCCLQTDVALTF